MDGATEGKTHHLHSHEDYLPELGKTYRLHGHDEYLPGPEPHGQEDIDEAATKEGMDELDRVLTERKNVEKRCVWRKECKKICGGVGKGKFLESLAGRLACQWQCGNDANRPTCS